MKHIQNNQVNLKKRNRKPKILRLLLNVFDFQTENHTLGYGSKNLKILSLAYGFLFFVISISGNARINIRKA
jgi:hypothetical protein